MTAGEQLLGLQARAVVVDEPADARLALPEEEVADDRADHRQAGRDAPAREDRGQRAAGNCSLQSRVNRLAPWSVNRSCWPWSADCSPNSVLVMIGKSAISTQTSTRLLKSKSNQKPISGTSARIGIVCSTTAYG